MVFSFLFSVGNLIDDFDRKCLIRSSDLLAGRHIWRWLGLGVVVGGVTNCCPCRAENARSVLVHILLTNTV